MLVYRSVGQVDVFVQNKISQPPRSFHYIQSVLRGNRQTLPSIRSWISQMFFSFKIWCFVNPSNLFLLFLSISTCFFSFFLLLFPLLFFLSLSPFSLSSSFHFHLFLIFIFPLFLVLFLSVPSSVSPSSSSSSFSSTSSSSLSIASSSSSSIFFLLFLLLPLLFSLLLFFLFLLPLPPDTVFVNLITDSVLNGQCLFC